MWRRAEIFNLRFAAARTLALCVPRTKLAAEPKSKATARAELDSAEGAGRAERGWGMEERGEGKANAAYYDLHIFYAKLCPAATFECST